MLIKSASCNAATALPISTKDRASIRYVLKVKNFLIGKRKEYLIMTQNNTANITAAVTKPVAMDID